MRTNLKNKPGNSSKACKAQYKLLYIFIPALFIFILTFVSCTRKYEVQNLGIFAQDRISSVVGQDGCTSIPLNNNTMLWTFGDTILGTWKKKVNMGSTFEDTAVMKNMLSNSLAYSRIPNDDNVQDLKFHFYKEKNQVAPFIKKSVNEKNNNIRLWAIDGIKVNKSVFVYYMLIRINKGTSELFTMNGIGLARWDIPLKWKDLSVINFKRLGRLFEKDSPTFGDSAIEKDNFIYLIGHKKNNKTNMVSAYISRVSTKNIDKRRSYEFLMDQGNWTRELNRATGFFHEVMGELSLSYNPYLKKYVIIYCAITGQIKFRAFSSFDKILESEPVVIYTPEKLKEIKNRPFLFYYSGKEIFHTEKAIYAIYIHPAIYQPILLKIPYEALTK